MRILGIDPSGNFNEGKGKTGWALIEDGKIISFGMIKASDHANKYDYWAAIRILIVVKRVDVVAIEDFRLYGSKAKSQINSQMETSKLLGFLEMAMHTSKQDFELQMARDAKSRFKDEILIHKGYVTKDGNNRIYINGINVANHVVDALRHALLLELRRRKR